VIDPMLPREMSSLVCTMSIAGRTTRVRFELGGPGAKRSVSLNDRVVATEAVTTPYRAGAVALARQVWMRRMDRDMNDLVISGS
jgi:hypothetical protein